MLLAAPLSVACILHGTNAAREPAPSVAAIVQVRPEASPLPEPVVAPWAAALEPILVKNPNAETEARILLYKKDGSLDAAAVEAFVRVVARDERVHPIKVRSIQLVFKAAYHFHAKEMVVISAYRPAGRGARKGPHAVGAAIDFQLPGVGARSVAAYARTYARAGVGIYTHPKTQFVHVDARDDSYHWVDSSPPGRTYREQRVMDPKGGARDAAWSADADLPEGVAD